MKASLLLALLLPFTAKAKSDLCYVTANAISVEVSSDRAGPILNLDAGDVEDSEGKASCTAYFNAFRGAYTMAMARAESLRRSGDCSDVQDTVGIRQIMAAVSANPDRRVLGSEFPAACR